MEKQYYYSTGQEQFGPLSYQQLTTQQLNANMLFWSVGMPEWKKGYELPELSGLFSKPSAQAGPPPIMPSPYQTGPTYPNQQYIPNQPSYASQPYHNPPLRPTPPVYEWYLGVWKKYAQFTGRARRSKYWYFVLFNSVVVFSLLMFTVSGNRYNSSTGTVLLYTLYNLAVLLPALAVAVRRMHDVGKSGWYILIPIYNLVLLCTEGDRGTNQYGPDPKYAI